MSDNTRGFKQLAALISTALSGEKPKSTFVGAGTQRAYARLKAKRIANQEREKNYLPIWKNRPPSRQVLRAESRRKAKEYRGMLKAAALKDTTPGGAAVVR